MYNFTYENRGSSRFLIYRIQENDEVDEMALGMLGQNKIAGILPVSYTQMDSDRYFRYSGLSTGTLKNLMGGIVTKSRILTVLENICVIIRGSEEYLLEGSAFVLDKEYIYVDGATGKTELIYLPLLNQSNAVSYAVFFKEIVTGIISDPSEDGTYVTRILYYLNSTENFSLTDFLRLIKELNLSDSVVDDRKAQRQKRPAPKPEPRKPAPPAPAPEAEKKTPEPKPQPKPAPEPGKPVPPAPKPEPRKAVPPVRKPVEKQEPPLDKAENKEEVYSFEFPGGGKVVQPPSRPSKPVKPEEQSGEEQEKMSPWYLLRNFNSENLEKFKNQGKSEDSKKAEKKPKEKKEKKEKRGRKKEPKNQGILTLVSMNPEYPKMIMVDKEEYLIGRRKTNDAVLSSALTNVSRDHCKIMREDNEYYVIDLRSTYGTIVDGVHCKPYEKSPALSEGSVIDLPGIQFRVEFH